MTTPKNPKSKACAKCGKEFVKNTPWGQVRHQVFCIEHFKKFIKRYKKQ